MCLQTYVDFWKHPRLELLLMHAAPTAPPDPLVERRALEMLTLVSIAELCHRLGVSRTTMWRAVRRSPILQRGRVQLTNTRTAFRLSAVEAWLDERSGKPVAPAIATDKLAAAAASVARRQEHRAEARARKPSPGRSAAARSRQRRS